MANNKQRYINTRLWNDSYVADLDPVEKLLFIYLLTNEHTNISGVYELPLKIMGVETGIETSMLKKIIPRIRHKIMYLGGKVVIKNFIKHQETSSPNVKKGILNCLQELDKIFLESIVKQGYYLLPKYYIDTLSIPYVEGRNYSNLDSNSNLDSIAGVNPADISLIIKTFEDIDLKNKRYYKNKTQREACSFLIQEYGLQQVINLIPNLKETNKTSFYQITTPLEMVDKITKVFNDVKRLSNIKNKGKGLA